LQVCAVLSLVHVFLPSYHKLFLVTGYGDGPDTPAPGRSSAASAAEPDSAPSTSRSGRKIRRTRKEKEDVSAEALSGGNILSGGEHQDKVEKKSKKRSKKKAVP
jgi:hypothetical protein